MTDTAINDHSEKGKLTRDLDEALAVDVQPFPLLGANVSVVLLLVEPEHLAEHGTNCIRYHFDLRPRRLVYTRRAGATRRPSTSNCCLCPSRVATRLTSLCCSGNTNVIPLPLLPARPVRPTR